MQAEGFGGELRSGYAVAARLQSWHLKPTEEGEHTVYFVGQVDAFLVQQRPLTLILRIGDLTWTWEDAVFAGGPVRISGAPIEGVKVLHGT